VHSGASVLVNSGDKSARQTPVHREDVKEVFTKVNKPSIFPQASLLPLNAGAGENGLGTADS